MRPELFAILDSHLIKVYRGEARADASRLRAVDANHFGRTRHAYWSSIRNDFIANEDELLALRNSLSTDKDSFVRQAAERLTEVRLLDILAW